MKVKRRKKTLTALVANLAEFIKALAADLGVDESRAKEIWTAESTGMSWTDRTDLILRGADGGHAVARKVRARDRIKDQQAAAMNAEYGQRVVSLR